MIFLHKIVEENDEQEKNMQNITLGIFFLYSKVQCLQSPRGNQGRGLC